jgi:hypothetical protein
LASFCFVRLARIISMGDPVFLQQRVVKGPVRHFAGIDEIFVESADHLQPAQHVGRLIERAVRAIERPSDFRRCVVEFVAPHA